MKTYHNFIGSCAVLLLVTVNLDSAADCDFNWSTMGSPNGAVYAIARSGNVLYVGGDFTSIGGIQANRIATWDGQNWSALIHNGGNGVGGPVRAIAIDGPDIYVGGFFLVAGVVNARNIAKWNGSSWSALGDGTNGLVQVISIGSDGIYVGGSFNQAGGIQANNVAHWSSGSWQKLEADYLGQTLNGVPGPVYALGVQYGSYVYIGGDFLLEGQSEEEFTYGLMVWDASSNTWNQFVVSPQGIVYCIVNRLGEMYLGGNFSGGIKSTFNGSSYYPPPGGGVNNSVNAICIDTVMDVIYAGGAFTTAGGSTANRIARWNGNSWFPLCSGVNNTVHAVVSMSSSIPSLHWGDVYVGGVFTTAGGMSVSNLAHWSNTSIAQKVSTTYKENMPSEYRLYTNFPNSFNPTTIIRFDLPEDSKVRLSIYSISGQLIANIVNNMMSAGQHSVEFNASELASGLYLYRFESGGIMQTHKMMLLK